ncbi:hypothetical protein ABZ667_14940 [Streptomyces lavendulae]|uniref:hypothetical protein n=1 Tax=Streptomyces lavendulae TaxID=1914 RepID=UPI0033C23CF9
MSRSGDAAPVASGPEKVRDAFAGLQATLGESCAPGNCAYFLGRVHDELHRMDRAMKADPMGPGHFPEPIAAVAKLDRELGGDRTFENLKKHQSTLIGTRDEINTWMQDTRTTTADPPQGRTRRIRLRAARGGSGSGPGPSCAG